MTMVFQVSQPGALDKLKAGDKVRFRASNKGGQLTASDIQPAR
jgi:Cu/Ag efflux protein CusF